MRFRTEIDIPKARFQIDHSHAVVLLGSCFTDHIGQRLSRDGFDVCANPFGPLFNPLSIANALERALNGPDYSQDDFFSDPSGMWHCLDYAMRFSGTEAEELARQVNGELSHLRDAIQRASALIVTFGSSVVYSLGADISQTVGNCHKLPASMFHRLTVEPSQIVARWQQLLQRFNEMNINVIVTVSPIRHLADGLHGNQLSKARLLLACEMLAQQWCYFPSYEIVMDDLRDYRFYQSDLKHPTEMACDYIYERFSDTFFSSVTLQTAAAHRAKALLAAHRPNLQK